MNKKVVALTVIGMICLVAGIFASISLGAKEISIGEIYNAIFHYTESELNQQLIREVRAPRMLSALLVGGMLALTGAMMQGVLKNPISEPSIMGVTQGATLAVAIASVSPVISGMYGNFFMGLFGSFLSGVLILLFSMRSAGNQSLSKILLAGTALSTFFLSLASVVALLGNRSQELAFWIAGGFRQANWGQVGVLVTIGGTFSVLALCMTGKINLINLGDEVAVGLGVSPEKIKLFTILCLIPICGVCVSAAGNIGFVGLFIPHIIRKIIGSDYRIILPLSFLWGSVVLVVADIFARMLMAPYELPVGLFTACIGVPVFLMLVRKENR